MRMRFDVVGETRSYFFPTCARHSDQLPSFSASRSLTWTLDLSISISNRTNMVLVSSKTLIQAHAVVLVIIAGYLIKDPAFITNADLVFMMGEALQMVRNYSLPQLLRRAG